MSLTASAYDYYLNKQAEHLGNLIKHNSSCSCYDCMCSIYTKQNNPGNPCKEIPMPSSTPTTQYNVTVSGTHNCTFLTEGAAKKRALELQKKMPNASVSVWVSTLLATVQVKQPAVEYVI
jgi:hypothetical protein